MKTKTEEEIKNTLEEIGVNVKSITQPSEGSFIVRGSTGPYTITLYIVIFGKTKKLEEHIAKLIELTLGVTVQPEKQAIKRTFDKHKTRLENLIKKASPENLAKAFPNLTSTLKKIVTEK